MYYIKNYRILHHSIVQKNRGIYKKSQKLCILTTSYNHKTVQFNAVPPEMLTLL